MSGWPEGIAVRSITTWPTVRTAKRVKSQFSAPMDDTLKLLRKELRLVSATEVVMEIAIPGGPTTNPSEWRQDGRPRSTARPDHPGVVIAFRSAVAGNREVRVATDRFRTWQENLRAIAKTLEHQRAFERYGTAMRGEQYAGWAQLTAGGPSPDRGESLIRQHGSVREALKATHPDRGGDPSDFADVQAARDAGPQVSVG